MKPPRERLRELCLDILRRRLPDTRHKGCLAYSCVLCGRSFRSLQALRSHLRKHRGEYTRSTVYVPRDLWDQVKERSRELGLTTCQVVVNLLKAWLQGSRQGGPGSPIQVNMTVIYLGRPRSSTPRVELPSLSLNLEGRRELRFKELLEALEDQPIDPGDRLRLAEALAWELQRRGYKVWR